MITDEQTEALLPYLLKTFNSSGELFGWLNMCVWPAFKARDKELRMSGAAKYNTLKQQSKKSDFGDLDPDAVAPAMLDLDGSPLTYREVNRRAEAGGKVLSKRTGAIVRWHEHKKRWEPLT